MLGEDAMNVFWCILDKIWPPLLAVILTQFLTKLRTPKLKIILEPRQEVKCTWEGVTEVCHAWRFLIKNKKSIDWLPLRETATNCHAKIEVFRNEKEVFKMNSRWANSAQISHLAQQDKFLKIQFPDPISIRSGKDEPLDGIVQFPRENNAFGWNNEAYFYKWRTPAYKLEKDEYRVVVTVSPQNGHEVSEEFKLIVSDNYDQTDLTKK